MSVDALFPVPEPTWLWVHDLVIESVGASVDGRGVTVAEVVTAELPVRGWLGGPDAKLVARGGGDGESLDAVARVPSDTAVTSRSWLRARPQVGLRPGMAGRYRVNAVRSTAADLRLLLTRVEVAP